MAHDLEKKWRSQDVHLKEDVDFSALLLCDRVLYGLKKCGFKKPSPIQLEAIPLSKIGKDLLVQAKSGTGKTLVFVITALEMLRRKLFRPQVLIIVPTREIAAQVCSVVNSVGVGFSKLTCFSFIGGMSITDDRENVKTCQIVVGTPGRINQLIREKVLATGSIRLLVFDEADQLLQMSFKEDIDQIFPMLPDDKQVITTSATYPVRLKKILFKYLREPHIACLNRREIALLGVIHYAEVVQDSPMEVVQYKLKLSVLEKILKTVKFSQCLVFCNGIQRVEVLYKDIKKWGFSTTYISSAKQQCDRLKAIEKLKRFKCKVLVSSDVTARGIDAENVDLVINFDLALSVDTYMHRAGRSGRYGSIGVCISIIEEHKIVYLKKMEAEVAFKTYKLPDPIPENLIQNTSFGNYFIGETDSEDEEPGRSSLDKDKPNLVVDTENNVIENTMTENNVIENTMTENNVIENTTTENGELSHNPDNIFDVTDCVLEKPTKTDKIPDVVPEIVSNSCLEIANELRMNSSESTVEVLENIDVPENENHVKPVEVDEGNHEDSSNMLTSDFFVSGNLDDGDLNCVIKTFLDGYAKNGIKYFNLNDKESELRSAEKPISICKINEFNYKKSSYVYEACKKYQTEKEKESRVPSEDKREEKVNKISTMSFQNEVCEPDNCSPKDAGADISLQNDMDCLSDLSDKQSLDKLKQSEPDQTSDPKSIETECRHTLVSNQKMLNDEVEGPEHETIQKLSVKPKFESSPLPDVKSQNDNSMDKSEDPNNKLVANFKPSFLRELSESDSNTEFNEDVALDVSQEFSSSDDSDEGSSCDFSDSSSSEDYEHNKFRTGKQNPSLVSGSDSDCSQRKHHHHSKCRPKESFCLKSHRPVHCSCSNYYPQYPYSYPQSNVCKDLRGGFRGHSRPSCCMQHVARGRSCLQPSEQRCSNFSCNPMQACYQWHATFYHQWRHIQTCMNSAPHW